MQKYYLFKMSVEPKVTRVRGVFVGVSVGVASEVSATGVPQRNALPYSAMHVSLGQLMLLGW